MSAGADQAVRVWSVATRRNSLRRFPDAFNSASGPRQITCDEDGQVRYCRIAPTSFHLRMEVQRCGKFRNARLCCLVSE